LNDWLATAESPNTGSAAASSGAADVIEAVRLPTFSLHALKGDRKGEWAIVVRADWRVTFKFEDGKALDVNYEDYR
jgi:toxin HigB-1